MATETRGRRAQGPTHEKLTISLPRELADKARAEVRCGRAASLSALIAGLLREKLEGDALQKLLDEMFREQPLTDEELAWADRVLDRLHKE